MTSVFRRKGGCEAQLISPKRDLPVDTSLTADEPFDKIDGFMRRLALDFDPWEEDGPMVALSIYAARGLLGQGRFQVTDHFWHNVIAILPEPLASVRLKISVQ